MTFSLDTWADRIAERRHHYRTLTPPRRSIITPPFTLGHSNVSVTSDIYAHSLPGWQKEAADAFADAMKE